MKCNIKVLSPVHIGSGENYAASEYVKSKAKTKKGNVLNIIKRMDVSKYFMSLDENKKDEFLRELSNPNFNLKDFDSKIPNNFMKYMAINKSKNEIAPTQEITEAIKTLNKLYIPGSSIKGAIESAILYNQFDYYDTEKIERFIDRASKREYNSFIDSFFSSDVRYLSAQKNVMKFLQISDTDDVKQTSVYDIVSIMAANFSGRKTNMYYRRNKKSKEPTISYYETVDAGNNLEFTINNNYNEKVHSALKLDDKIDLIDIKNIKKAIYNFSSDYINHEMKFSDEYDMNSLNKFYKRASKLNTKDTPLLKIGAGSGFLATTLALKIKEYDYSLFERIRKQKKGYDFCFPKSRKITVNGGKPLGWVQLSFKEE